MTTEEKAKRFDEIKDLYDNDCSGIYNLYDKVVKVINRPEIELPEINSIVKIYYIIEGHRFFAYGRVSTITDDQIKLEQGTDAMYIIEIDYIISWRYLHE